VGSLREAGEGFAKLRHLGRGHRHAIALVRIAFKEILVIGLGGPIVHQRQQLGYQDHAADADFWQSSFKGQMFLGDGAFVDRMQALAQSQALDDRTIPRQQRKRTPCTWPEALAACDQDRNRAIAWAYASGGITMTALAQNTGQSVAHIGRIVAAAECLQVK